MWAKKLLEEHEAGRLKKAVLIIRPSTEALWWQPLWAYPICFIRGRVPFTAGPGTKHSRPTIATAIVGFGIDHNVFVEAFRELEQVVLPTGDGGVSVGVGGRELGDSG